MYRLPTGGEQSGCNLAYKPRHKHHPGKETARSNLLQVCQNSSSGHDICRRERQRNNSDKQEVMLGQDQTSDEGVAGLGTKFTGNTNTPISLSSHLLLSVVAYQKKRGVKFSQGSAWRGSMLSLNSRLLCVVVRLYCLQNSVSRKQHRLQEVTQNVYFTSSFDMVLSVLDSCQIHLDAPNNKKYTHFPRTRHVLV